MNEGPEVDFQQRVQCGGCGHIARIIVSCIRLDWGEETFVCLRCNTVLGSRIKKVILSAKAKVIS